MRTAVDGDAIWSELGISGSVPMATDTYLRGVIILGVLMERASWSRF